MKKTIEEKMDLIYRLQDMLTGSGSVVLAKKDGEYSCTSYRIDDGLIQSYAVGKNARAEKAVDATLRTIFLRASNDVTELERSAGTPRAERFRVLLREIEQAIVG